MNSDLQSLSKIFHDSVFRIPDYQRGYAWGPRELEAFWQDISLLAIDREHYTGVLTFESVPAEAIERWDDDRWLIQTRRYTPYYVVDGQQRLTTAVILIQAILDRVGEAAHLNETSYSDIVAKYVRVTKASGVQTTHLFGYERDNPSYHFLKTRIFHHSPDTHELGTDTLYTNNLLRAQKFFSERLAPLDHSDIELLYRKLTQNLLFNIFIMTGAIDVHVAFETMNNRGKALSHLELMKNRLIYLTSQLSDTPDEQAATRRKINEAWKGVFHALGRTPAEDSSDDRFLWVHFVNYYTNREEFAVESPRLSIDDGWKRYLLDYKFGSGSIRATPAMSLVEIDRYATDLLATSERYRLLLDPTDSAWPEECRGWIDCINRLSVDYATPLLDAVLRTNRNKIPADMLVELERLLFLAEWSQPRIRHRVFQLARSVMSGSVTLAAVTDQIRDVADTHAGEEAMSRRALTLGAFYRWHNIRYFLYEYERSLQDKSLSKTPRLSWEETKWKSQFDETSSVEHVYPQKPVPADWPSFAGFSSDQLQTLTNALGNLVLVASRRNSSLRNRSFIAKRDGEAGAACYRNGSFAEIEISGHADWSPERIVERSVELMAFFEKRWRLTTRTRAQRIRILGLESVEKTIKSRSRMKAGTD